ncbi:hydrolase [Sinorhizobium glycinis]|uniref:Hydrolase n=1 Tax=Sinorhizobium glycinis TaxID=1472378 RepID=A0A178XR52_9HYPH|nr:amidohydrolase family protein [Sinorhizobium glycinis]OAP37667.1 hydrolase [Sinorhizobium glycinis]
MKGAYRGPVIDPHHHLWDLSLRRHPWLMRGQPGGEEPGNVASLQRDYGVAEYLADAARQNIVATVHVEAGWSDDFPLEETHWLDGIDKRSGVARRYVARVPLDRPDAGRLLEVEAANPNVVGVRDIVSWHPDPSKSFAARDGRMSDRRWRAGLAEASRLGLSFDLMLFPRQMGEAVRLVADFPQTRFVLNHCGSPIDRSEEGMALWRKGLRELARAENVSVKVSDLVAYDHDWTLSSLRPVIEFCIECFGPSRSMFASDFPVAAAHATFDEVYGVFRTVAAPLSSEEQRALFFSTANEAYRLAIADTTTAEDGEHA